MAEILTFGDWDVKDETDKSAASYKLKSLLETCDLVVTRNNASVALLLHSLQNYFNSDVSCVLLADSPSPTEPIQMHESPLNAIAKSSYRQFGRNGVLVAHWFDQEIDTYKEPYSTAIFFDRRNMQELSKVTYGSDTCKIYEADKILRFKKRSVEFNFVPEADKRTLGVNDYTLFRGFGDNFTEIERLENDGMMRSFMLVNA